MSQILSTGLSFHIGKKQKCNEAFRLVASMSHLLLSWIPDEKDWELGGGGSEGKGTLRKYLGHSRLVFLPGAKLS